MNSVKQIPRLQTRIRSFILCHKVLVFSFFIIVAVVIVPASVLFFILFPFSQLLSVQTPNLTHRFLHTSDLLVLLFNFLTIRLFTLLNSFKKESKKLKSFPHELLLLGQFFSIFFFSHFQVRIPRIMSCEILLFI